MPDIVIIYLVEWATPTGEQQEHVYTKSVGALVAALKILASSAPDMEKLRVMEIIIKETAQGSPISSGQLAPIFTWIKGETGLAEALDHAFVR